MPWLTWNSIWKSKNNSPMKTELQLTQAALDAAKKIINSIPITTLLMNAHNHLDDWKETLSALAAFKAEQEKESQYTATITVEKSGEITRTPVVPESMKCPDCNGSGAGDSCELCGGSGEIEV